MTAWSNYWKDLPQSPEESSDQLRIGRTENKIAVTDERWQLTVKKVIHELNIESSSRVLDLAGGNALFSRNLKMRDGLTVCADISHSLLLEAQEYSTNPVECDIRSLPFSSGSFDRVVIYAAVQYLQENDAVLLLKRCREILTPTGQIFIGDIPDTSARFRYFDDVERRKAYFNSINSSRPLIGTWFSRDWFAYALEFAGFRNTRILDQSEWEPYKKFRFDAIAQCQKVT